MTALQTRSVLVLGGARSGKSAYAQSLAEAAAPERLYLATAEAGDAEMADRIARHQETRGAGWTTREEPLDLVEAVGAEARPGRVVLVDCLTLWITNLMFSGRDIEAEIVRLAQAVGASAARRSSFPTRSGWGSCRRTGSAAISAISRAGRTRRSRAPATRSCSSPPVCRR